MGARENRQLVRCLNQASGLDDGRPQLRRAAMASDDRQTVVLRQLKGAAGERLEPGHGASRRYAGRTYQKIRGAMSAAGASKSAIASDCRARPAAT
jgi:hypothetical protein